MPPAAETSIETRKLPLPTLLAAGRAALLGRFLLLVSGLGNSLLLPLALDMRGVGLFFISQVYVAGVTITAMMGLTLTIPAEITAAVARRDFAGAKHTAIVALCLSTAASLALGALTATAGFALLSMSGWTENPELHPVIWIISATIPLTTIAALAAEMLRSFHLYRWASNLSVLGGAAPVAYLLLCLLLGWHATLPNVLAAGLAGSGLGAMLGLFRLARHLWLWEAVTDRAGWLDLARTTLPNLATTVTLFALSQADIVLLSIWMGPEAVAHYGVSLRLAALLILPLSIANSAFAPIAVELSSTDQTDQLQRTCRQIATGAVMLAALGYAGFALLGPWLISLWNPSYGEIYWLFLLLGAGQVLHAGFGAGGMMLMILGHQLGAMWLTMALSAATTVLGILGLLVGGAPGLALVSATGNATQAGVFWWQAKKRLNIDTAFRIGRK